MKNLLEYIDEAIVKKLRTTEYNDICDVWSSEISGCKGDAHDLFVQKSTCICDFGDCSAALSVRGVLNK